MTKSAFCRVVACGTALFLAAGCGDDGARIADPPDSPINEVLLGAPAGFSHYSTRSGDAVHWGVPEANATERTLAGYNLYIFDPNPETGTSYVRVNASPLTVRNYTFPSLQTGETFYLRVTAVDTDGSEGTTSPTLQFVARGPESGRPDHLGQYGPGEADGSGQQY